MAVLIFTNLVLLPILLSYTGVSARAAARSLQADSGERRGASAVAVGLPRPLHAAPLGHRGGGRQRAAGRGLGFAVSLHLKIGDLDPGAPELRADSRYNRDNAFMIANYAASADILAVMVKTRRADQCTQLRTLAKRRRAGVAAGAAARRGVHQLDGRAVQAGHGRLQRRQLQMVSS